MPVGLAHEGLFTYVQDLFENEIITFHICLELNIKKIFRHMILKNYLQRSTFGQFLLLAVLLTIMRYSYIS